MNKDKCPFQFKIIPYSINSTFQASFVEDLFGVNHEKEKQKEAVDKVKSKFKNEEYNSSIDAFSMQDLTIWRATEKDVIRHVVAVQKMYNEEKAIVDAKWDKACSIQKTCNILLGH